MQFSRRALAALVAASLTATASQAAPGPAIDVAMDRGLVSVVVRFGVADKEPSTWEGSYRLTDGRIVATDGWRFTGDDYATLSEFKFAVRRFYPRFWNRRGNADPSKLSTEPNGVVLTLANLAPSSVLKVSTQRGDFSVPVGKLAYGSPQKALQGNVDYQRLPTSREIVRAPTEDGYPAALRGAEGRLAVAYIAFTNGKGFEAPLRIPTEPEDLSFLASPPGGDQLMFTELDGSRWTTPTALSEAGGDLFGTAMALDGQGRLWVVWAANVDGNWDLYARFRSGKRWSAPIQVSSAPGADFNHAAVTDSEGRVWLAWQSFGPSNSDIYVARQEGDGFGKPVAHEAVARDEANDWAPAIAASDDGRVAVAWDSYREGNYDVLVRIWQQGTWGSARPVAATLANEARPTLAFDCKNRLWIAYEVSPEGWGKDYGAYDQGPLRMPLYRQRSIGVKVLEGSRLLVPEADVNLALPKANGQPRHGQPADDVLAAGPKLAVDSAGRLWLAARIRLARFDSSTGGTWMSFLTTLDPDAWRPSALVPQTDAFLHESSALVPAEESGLYVVSCSDGRFRNAAAFGPIPGKKKRRSPQLPPPCTRDYATYPDTAFNMEIAVADTGRVAPGDRDAKLVAAEPAAVTGPSAQARQEAKDVAAIRSYRAVIGGAPLRIVRGEFHRHTEISSDGAGDGSIFDMWRYALDMGAMDWIGNGDHDNGNNREFSWWFVQKTSSIFNVPGAFASMFTYERSVSYPDGHRNAVFARRGIRPLARLQGGMGKPMDDLPADAPRPKTPDTQMFYRYLHFFDGVCASHTSGTDMGTDWRDNDPKVEPVVEIYQGDRQNYELPGAPRSNSADYSLGGWRPMGFVANALMKGYRLGFQSSSDHISTHMSYCNVWVEEPTREAILEGLKRRRVYGATDNIIADVRSGEHFMGEEFTVDKPPVIDVKLIGTAPFAEVVIVKDNQYVYSARPNKRIVEFHWTDAAAKPGRTSYYYVRGTQVGQTEERHVRSTAGEKITIPINNGQIVWVSPMWITYKP